MYLRDRHLFLLVPSRAQLNNSINYCFHDFAIARLGDMTLLCHPFDRLPSWETVYMF